MGLGGDARIKRGVLVEQDRGIAAHRVYPSLRPQGGEQDPRRVDVPERDLIRPDVSRFIRGHEVIRFVQRGDDRFLVFLPQSEFADAVLDRAAVVNRSRQPGLPHRGLRVGVKFDDRSRIVDRDFTAGGGNTAFVVLGTDLHGKDVFSLLQRRRVDRAGEFAGISGRNIVQVAVAEKRVSAIDVCERLLRDLRPFVGNGEGKRDIFIRRDDTGSGRQAFHGQIGGNDRRDPADRFIDLKVDQLFQRTPAVLVLAPSEVQMEHVPGTVVSVHDDRMTDALERDADRSALKQFVDHEIAVRESGIWVHIAFRAFGPVDDRHVLVGDACRIEARPDEQVLVPERPGRGRRILRLLDHAGGETQCGDGVDVFQLERVQQAVRFRKRKMPGSGCVGTVDRDAGGAFVGVRILQREREVQHAFFEPVINDLRGGVVRAAGDAPFFVLRVDRTVFVVRILLRPIGGTRK